MKVELILYLIQIIPIIILFVCSYIVVCRNNNAIAYMETYIKEHQNKKGIVGREFRKVIKMLGGKWFG